MRWPLTLLVNDTNFSSKVSYPIYHEAFFFLCRGSSARKSTWLILYRTFCLSELSKALLLNGARGPMVERTTGCRYLPGATIQSEEVTDWVRTSTFKCFNLVMLQFYSYITYYFILNRLFLFDMYYCVFWHNKTKLKSSDHHALCLKHVVWQELKLPSFKGQSPQLNFRRYFADLIAIVSNRFRLCPAARHLAVYLLDLFMDRYDVTVQQLHMVSLSCLLLASKCVTDLTLQRVNKISPLSCFLKVHFLRCR